MRPSSESGLTIPANVAPLPLAVGLCTQGPVTDAHPSNVQSAPVLVTGMITTRKFGSGMNGKMLLLVAYWEESFEVIPVEIRNVT